MNRLQLMWSFGLIHVAGVVFIGPRYAKMALLHGLLLAWLKRSLILLRNLDTIKQR